MIGSTLLIPLTVPKAINLLVLSQPFIEFILLHGIVQSTPSHNSSLFF